MKQEIGKMPDEIFKLNFLAGIFFMNFRVIKILILIFKVLISSFLTSIN
jgi:hypothetical protein